MNKYTKYLNVFVVFALLLSFVGQAVAQSPAPTKTTKVMKDSVAEVAAPRSVAAAVPVATGLDPNPKQALAFEQVEATEVVDMNEPARYIIQFEDAPLATYAGGVGRMAATNPQVRGERKLNVTSPESVIYMNYLENKQGQFLTTAQKTLGRSMDVLFNYRVAYNGLALEMTPLEAAKIAELPGVRRVTREIMRYPVTDAGPEWIGAGGVWDGSATGVNSKGEGIVIGVIDTGINADHPSFAEVGPSDGYVHTNPMPNPAVGNTTGYYGWCDNLNPNYTSTTFVCNDKLIGGYDFADAITHDPDDGPEDSNGHGSHVASTAAGNVLQDIEVDLGTTTVTTTISGVAPHANIIMYDACGVDNTDGCPPAATLAAIEQATIDGVDVINYSIGGDLHNPWGDPDSEAFLNARYAGIYVSIAASNKGPGPGTIGSPANSPWAQVLGNASHNRTFTNTLSFTGGPEALDPMRGTSISSAYGPAPIVHAGDYGDPLCGTAFMTDTWTSGEIVVCDRGTFALVVKVANAAAGGAGGVVIANAEANGVQTYASAYQLPSTHINYADAELLRTWLMTGTAHIATISASNIEVDDSYGDRVATGSSRGPNAPVPDVIKPDVLAPGSDILAAYRTPEEYASIGGTSMASPHGAGAGILMRSLYPDWTESQIQSAIMSTGIYTQAMKEDWVTPADPFDYGAGRIFISSAANAGFVLDETYDNFVDADPGEGGDPSTLNLASLGQDECLGMCSWTRALSSTLPYTVTWTTSYVSADGLVLTTTPSVFELAPYATQEITIVADLDTIPLTETWKFGHVIFTPDVVTPSVAHFPVAVDPATSILPNPLEVETRRDAGSVPVNGLRSMAASDLTITKYGLAGPTLHEFSLGQAFTSTAFPAIFFQGMTGTEYIEVMVPAGGGRLVAEILETTSPDLDMLVFRDLDDDATPELSDVNNEACQSAAGGPYEFCDIMMPAAGRWYVAVINYAASAAPPDDIVLATTVVGSDVGNMMITGPSVVESGVPYDLRFYWDDPMMMAGATWYGVFTLGSDSAHVDDIGTIPVNIYRLDDDVVKTVDPMMVNEGETVTYTMVVDMNVLPEDLSYMLTDTIPTGMTYVPGSLQASAGVASEAGGVITWEGMLTIPHYDYAVSDSLSDPLCSMPLANSGAYVDLEGYGIPTDSTVDGAGPWVDSSYGGNPYAFYDNPTGTSLHFTDEGYVSLDINSVSGGPYPNATIPSAGLPDALMAPIWRQLNIVYQAGSGDDNWGVTTGIQLTTDGIPSAKLLEFDNIQLPGDPSSNLDFEVIIYELINDAAGAYEVRFAYDNLNGDFANMITGTIGVENHDGTVGTQYAYDDIQLQDGMAVCYDAVLAGTEPVTITYQATVDVGMQGETITNTVYHSTDNPGGMEAMSDAPLMVYPNNTLTINIVGNGTVNRTPDQPNYISGTQVMMEAVAAQYWMFDGWSSDMTLLTNPVTVTMDSDKVVTATFIEVNQAPVAVDDSDTTLVNTPVTVDVLANDSDVNGDALTVADVGAASNGTVANNGTNVTYTPTTDFMGTDSFTYTVSDGELTDMGVVTIVVTDVVYYDLDVNVVGSGSVALTPPGGTYVEDTDVMMMANPQSGWVFDGWSGDVVSTDNPYTVTMTSDMVVTATFVEETVPTYTLTVNVVGSGSVTLDPNQTVFNSGETVQLTAEPDTDWYFAGWEGDLGGMDNPATLTMDSDKVVTATFTSEPVVTYTLTVTVTGSGSVTVEPDATIFISGTTVQLTAVPDTNWTFDAWSGAVVSTTNPVSIVMDEDKTIMATFVEVGEESMVYLPLVMKN